MVSPFHTNQDGWIGMLPLQYGLNQIQYSVCGNESIRVSDYGSMRVLKYKRMKLTSV